MENLYVIVDTETGRFYQGDTDYLPWIACAFGDCLECAARYSDKDKAKDDIEYFEMYKTGFDGNTPLRKGRLAVMQITLTPVE